MCENCAGTHFIRREGKDTGEAAFSASERHFQETLKSNRFSLGREISTDEITQTTEAVPSQAVGSSAAREENVSP